MFLKGNPKVAASLADLSTNIHLYYIDDHKERLDGEYSKLQLEKKAMKEYLKLSDTKTRLVLRVLSAGAEAAFNAEDSEKEIDILMMKEIKESPANFLNIVNDKQLETKALIQELHSAGMIRKVKYTYLSDDVKLGDNLEEAALFLEDPNNSDVLLTLKSRLKHATV